MDSMNTMSSSLPHASHQRTGSQRQSQPPQPPVERPGAELIDAFKQAAMSVTNIYKVAQKDIQSSRKEGYQDCLEDILGLLDNVPESEEGDGPAVVSLDDLRYWVMSRSTRRKDEDIAERDEMNTDEVETAEDDEEPAAKSPPKDSPGMHAPRDPVVPSSPPSSDHIADSPGQLTPTPEAAVPTNTEDSNPLPQIPSSEFTYRAGLQYPGSPHPEAADPNDSRFNDINASNIFTFPTTISNSTSRLHHHNTRRATSGSHLQHRTSGHRSRNVSAPFINNAASQGFQTVNNSTGIGSKRKFPFGDIDFFNFFADDTNNSSNKRSSSPGSSASSGNGMTTRSGKTRRLQ